MFYLSDYSSKAANLAKRLSKDPKEHPQSSNLEQGAIKPSVRNNLDSASASISKVLPSSSFKLNNKQLQVWTLFDTYFRELKSYRAGIGHEPTAPRIFVHGGPGTGKTFLINAITENL